MLVVSYRRLIREDEGENFEKKPASGEPRDAARSNLPLGAKARSQLR